MIACNEDGLGQLESADTLEDESGASIFEGVIKIVELLLL